MRDDEARAAGHEGLHGVDDGLLGAGVHARGGLVEDEDGRVAQHRAGDGEQLALAGAHGLGVVGEARVVAVGQRADEVVHVGRLGRGDDLLARGAGLAVGDVLGDGAVEQPGVLQHHAELAPQVGRAHLVRVNAVERDAAATHLVEAHEQVDEGRLAGARGSHDGDLLAGLGHEAHVAHEGLLGLVAEAHVLELDAALHGLGAGERLGRVSLDLVLVKDGEDALGGGERPLQHADGHGELRERLGARGHVLEERLEDAHGELAGEQHLAGDDGHGDLAQAQHEADDGAHGVGEEIGLGARGREFLGGGQHLGGARLVAAEGLDDGAAGVGLLHLAGELAQGGLPGRGHAQGAGGEELGDEQGHHAEADEDHRERHADGEHHRHRADHGERRDEDLQKAALEHLGDLVEVVGGAADGVAGLVVVEVGQRQALELGGKLLAQLEVELLGEARHDEVVGGVEGPGKRPDAEEDKHLRAAVLEREDEVCARGVHLLDVGPQQIDQVGAVAHGRQRAHHVEDRREGHEHEPPALAGHGLPQAAHGAEGVVGDLELLFGLGFGALVLLGVRGEDARAGGGAVLELLVTH